MCGLVGDYMSIEEIIYLYKVAKDKDKEVFILAVLTESDADTIIEILKDHDVYEEKHIQRCFNCHELYIEHNRCRTCDACRRTGRRINGVRGRADV